MAELVGNLFTEVPRHPRSHVRGWALHWAESLRADGVLTKDVSLDGVSTLYFDHGVNSEPGQMNLFGGITDQVVDRLEQLADNPHLDVVSLDDRMPREAYVSGLRKRVGQTSCSPRLTEALISELDRRLARSESQWIKQVHLVEDSVCIGDSHSTAYAERGQPVIRRNGLTLHHAVYKDYFRSLLGFMPDSLKKATLVAGSIDIRHHVGLQPDPEEAVVTLARDLVDLAAELEGRGLEVELAVPVPVEFEGRRIPKTGWLNDRPFTGSLEQRQMWTDVFASVVGSHTRVVAPPRSWYEMDPEEYARAHMELSSSFHVAPPDYRRHGGWDVHGH